MCVYGWTEILILSVFLLKQTWLCTMVTGDLPYLILVVYEILFDRNISEPNWVVGHLLAVGGCFSLSLIWKRCKRLDTIWTAARWMRNVLGDIWTKNLYGIECLYVRSSKKAYSTWNTSVLVSSSVVFRQRCPVCLFLTKERLKGRGTYQSHMELCKAKCLHTYNVPGTKYLYGLLIHMLVNWDRSEWCILLMLGIRTKVEIQLRLVV